VGAVVRALADVASADAWTPAVPAPRTAPQLPSASRRPAPAPVPPEVVLTPRESWYAATERVDLDAAIDRIAAEPVTPYPPGVPLLAAGELVTGDLVAVLRHLTDQGTHLHGCADPELRTLRVVAEPLAGSGDGPLAGLAGRPLAGLVDRALDGH
jgi:lysine decarboxylase